MRVLVGMSGGVDSTVTALLLKEQGYEVTGVYLQFWKDESEEVRILCEQLGIAFVTYDCREEFRKEVVSHFISEYSKGRTPNPCAFCNNTVKWKMLYHIAEREGIERIATGHYIRIKDGYICKGVDGVKDQSYFLWGVPRFIIARSLTPLGDYTKVKVKEIAAANGLERVMQKRESMGICFLEGKDYRSFIAEHGGVISEPGEIVDRAGNVLGMHMGLPNYTIGQKRDMPLRNGMPLYVADIIGEKNQIVADEKANLMTRKLILRDINLIDLADLEASDISVKVRGLGLNPEGYAEVIYRDELLEVNLSHAAWAAAPGQPIALYRGERVIGGGIML